MEKKKVFIMMTSMHIGGAERALIGILNSFDYTKYEVDLFLLQHTGEFMDMIPKEVNLLPENPKYRAVVAPFKAVMKQGHVLIALARAYGKYKSKRFLSKQSLQKENLVIYEYPYKYSTKYLPPINPEVTYDLAVSFILPHYFVTHKVKAKKKIAWIHTDYSSYIVDVQSELNMWSAYDHIMAISEQAEEAFVQRFPPLQNKLIVMENILSADFIRKQSEEQDVSDEIKQEDNVVSLLSVGRFCYAKNFISIPKKCKYLIDQGINVKWYLIGFGSEETAIKDEIQAQNMEDHVIILGKKENPYPYMKACDFFVLPSHFEGKAIVVREAQILGKPVVITDFPTAKCQLKDGFDGIIVPGDDKQCAHEMYKLITDQKKSEQLSRNCLASAFGNEEEIEKLYELMQN